ncbi:hypothetical protein AB595_04730 [Massilia sp. WF1]|uniref:hypothetical protein n=1 Tax=unclassified Massilia TaxID=2609279 RepID=UPI00064AF906|nr:MULTISPECIES: hypothetical protein [unclassified Massilia]ALK96981.1 hypothetical protein AM586_12640 [Massilia sp. WG5]KLU37931.1 hypothetical protein AB595_04730 [Massilia sp. WF1]
MDSLTITTTGANIATSGTSARVPIPPAQSGEIPRYIRVIATAAAHIKMGTSTVTAVAADLMVQPADSVNLVVPRGITHIAAIQDTAAGTVNIVPLEDC